MMRVYVYILVTALLAFASDAAYSQPAQVPDNTPQVLGKSEDIQKPRGFGETMMKMRIEKEKKDFAEMLERGEEALKISEQLEKSFAVDGRLTRDNYERIAKIEKLTKKIRSELGGDDDDDDEDKPDQPLSEADAVKSLRERVVGLYDALKKTSRFSISAAAIEGTNAVLKIARFLKISN